jgi:hypothetical protein
MKLMRLISSTLGAAALLLAAPSSSFAQVLARENINTFSQDPVKLQKLRDAVAALQERGPNNAADWFNMAGIHGILSSDPQLPNIPAGVRALFNQCHQDPALFFLWHRAYVASLEHLMQEAIHDPSFRLPYWDWYSDPSLPAAFRDEFLDPGQTKRNPLYKANRNLGINNGNPVWSPALDTNYDNDDFLSFQGQLESNEHGSIHVAVGRPDNMGRVPFAARDPIFFLHHANIDRLLMVWLKKDPASHHAPAQVNGWDAAHYRFPDSLTGITTATPTYNELALNAQQALGYTYDNLEMPSVQPFNLPAQPLKNAALAPVEFTQLDDKVHLFAATSPTPQPFEIGDAANIELKIPAVAKEKITPFLLLPKTPQTLSLVFENLRVKEMAPDVLSYRVFINLPKEPTKENYREHFVTNISLFDAQDSVEGHGAGPKAPLKVKITSANGGAALLKALEASTDGTTVKFSFVPVLRPGGNVPVKPVLSIGRLRLEGVQP